MGAHSAPRKSGSRYLTLAAVAVLAVVAWWFFFGRGDGASRHASLSAPPAATEAESSDSGTATLQKRSATGTVETFEVFASRDPFSPLVDDEKSDGPSAEGNRVKLVDAADDGVAGAQVEVNGTVYTVAEGETFAENFKLLSVSGDCASLLFGDDQFTICEGEEIFK